MWQRRTRRVRPLCERLGVEAGGYTRGLQKAVVDFGAEDSFEPAAQRLCRHHPVSLSASTVRKIALTHAKELSGQQRVQSSFGKLLAQGAGRIVAQADGTMLPVVEFTPGGRKVGWKEMRLCAARVQDREPVHYDCEMRDVEEPGLRWSPCAGRSGWAVGSGMIEGAHRHVLQKRLKFSGSWRSPDNLADRAQLRVCRANRQWERYWKIPA